MSARRLIAELQQRQLLNDRQLDKLREAAAQKEMSAAALAKFLVAKNHLTQKQATDSLHALVLSGVDVHATHEPTAPTPGPVQLGIADANIDDIDEDPESSSIFASFLEPPVRTSQISSLEADELMLVPDEDKPPPERVERSSRASRDSAPSSNDAGGLDIDLGEPRPGLKQLAKAERGRQSVATKSSRSKTPTGEERKSTKRLKKKSTWDSPLMLWGSGALVLMMLVGALLWWLLIYESADQQLILARTAAESGAYAESIKYYQDFIEGSPSHPENDLAKVQLVLLRIRQATEAADFAKSLELAENELKSVEDNEEFDKAHGELASLLPQIAAGLAGQAEKAPVGSPEAAESVKLANKALELCSNVMFIPKTLRDEGKLTAVRQTLDVIERRGQVKAALDASLATMQQSLGAGDTNKSYATYRELLETHSELTDNKELSEKVQQTTAAEQAAIKFTADDKTAETSDQPAPWVASLAVANRRVKPQPDAVPATATGIACFRIDGALYALDVATGKLLWRRYVGPGSQWPQLVENDVLVTDTRRHELLRLNAQTGNLVWRQAIGEPFAAPLVLGTRALVAAQSGKLFAIEMKSGQRAGFVKLPQPIHVAPAANPAKGCIYVVGDHSTIYTLKATDLSCLGVYYLGHADGSIAKSPAAVMDKVAIIENDGASTSRLRLYTVADNGAIDKPVGERRLTGLPSAPPMAAGRRIVVITDRGQIDVFDVGGEGEQTLNPVATRVATGNTPLVRYVALAQRNIWIGDTQLTKFSILPAGNRLPVEAIENDFVGSTFDHPLELFGDVLVSVRRAKGRAGAVVAATATAQGNTLWETDVATPPAGSPVVDEAAKAIAVASAEGALFRFDEAAIRSRIQDEPLAPQAAPSPLPELTSSVDLGNGRAAFGANGSDQLLLYNPALGPAAARWIKLESPLACPVARLGEGFVAPLTIGQVFLLSSADGSKLAAPFQTLLQPEKVWHFSPPGTVDGDATQFVITAGEGKVYRVELVNDPQPHLKAAAEADMPPQSAESPLVVLNDRVFGVTGDSRLVSFQFPSLEPTGEELLPASITWGPHRVGDVMLVALADKQLMAIAADGKAKWQVPIEHGDLAGPPLATAESVLLTYRNGILERRSLADGKPAAAADVEQPLAAGPVAFLGRILLVTNDGTLLVVDQP